MIKSGLAVKFAVAAALILSGCEATHSNVAGTVTRDGTVYAGMSPDTGKAFYTTPTDAPESYVWSEATAHCRALDAFGHQDWRVPTRDELDTEFNARAAIGGFNETGSVSAGLYWSSFANDTRRNVGWVERFSDGYQFRNHIGQYHASLRCVR